MNSGAANVIFDTSRLNRQLIFLTFWGTLLALISPIATAGALLEYEGRDFESNTQILVGEGKVLIESVEESPLSMIYERDRDAFLLLDHTDKTYIDFSTTLINGLLSGVQAIIPQLQQLGDEVDMSPEQREMLQRLANKTDIPESNGIAVVVRQTGETRQLHGLTCQVQEVTLAKSLMNVCTVAYSKVGVSDDDKNSLAGLSKAFTQIVGSIRLHEAQQLAAVVGQLDGVMLEATDASGNTLIKLKSLMLNTVSASRFGVPADYDKTDIFSALNGM